MLPPKIRDFLVDLTRRTESGEFVWRYNDDEDTVSISTPAFGAHLTYSFDNIQECGQFQFEYVDARENKAYHFQTNQMWNDFDIARRLFDAAQSSGLNLPF